jgi:hypothetical protein
MREITPTSSNPRGRKRSPHKHKILKALIRERRNGQGWKRSYQLAGNAKIKRQSARRAIYHLYHVDKVIFRRDTGRTWYGKPIYEYRVCPEYLGLY